MASARNARASEQSAQLEGSRSADHEKSHSAQAEELGRLTLCQLSYSRPVLASFVLSQGA